MPVGNLVEENVVSTGHAILEIDDEPKDSILAERYLEELEARRETAESLDEAQQAVRFLGPLQDRYGCNNVVIVLDLMFPENNNDPDVGIQFIREVRGGLLDVHPCTPVVVRSNAGDPETVESAKLAGASDFFTKTVDPRRFIDALAFYLGKEVLEATALCEVLDLKIRDSRVSIRMRGREDWIVERSIGLDMCPQAARVVGGAFYLETFKRFRNYQAEYVMRPKSVDKEEEAQELEQLLFPELP